MNDKDPQSENQINESRNQNIENLTSRELSKVLNASSAKLHNNFAKNIISHLNSVLNSVVTDRNSYYIELAKYKDNFITQGIYDILSNDILLDVSSSQSAINIKVPEYPDAEEELIDLFARLNIVEVVQSILPDLLHYGSYPLRPIVRDDRGVIDLVDDLTPQRVLPLCDSKNNPIVYFISDQDILSDYLGTNYNSSRDFKFSYYPITDVINFSLDLKFIKVNLENPLNGTHFHIPDNTPDIAKKLLPGSLRVKVSRSFIWPILDKIKELLALDKMNIYNSIGKLLTPKLVGVPLPNNQSIEDAIEAVDRYNELLNSNIFSTTDISALDINLREMSQLKAVPIIGDRSTLTPMDVGAEMRPSDIDTFNNSLDLALNSLGISPEVFRGNLSGKESIKNNVRYARNVKRIQKNISRTLSFLGLLHLSKVMPQYNIAIEDIQINLRNNTNVDELENLETMDLMISSISNVNQVLTDIQPIIEKSSYEVDNDAIIESIITSFANSGSIFHTAFKIKEEDTEQAAEDNPDGDAESGGGSGYDFAASNTADLGGLDSGSEDVASDTTSDTDIDTSGLE